MPAPVPGDEKLAQINFLRLLAIQGVSHHCTVIFKQHRGVFGRQPAFHPLLQFGNRHAISVSLVADQLMIEFSQQSAIVQRCSSKGHTKP